MLCDPSPPPLSQRKKTLEKERRTNLSCIILVWPPPQRKKALKKKTTYQPLVFSNVVNISWAICRRRWILPEMLQTSNSLQTRWTGWLRLVCWAEMKKKKKKKKKTHRDGWWYWISKSRTAHAEINIRSSTKAAFRIYCKGRNFRRRKKFVLFHTKPFVWNLISYSQIDRKMWKTEDTIERLANQVEENLVWKLISYIFQYMKATKLNSLRKFLLLQYTELMIVTPNRLFTHNVVSMVTSAIGWPPWLITSWYLWIWRNHVNAQCTSMYICLVMERY